MTETLLMVFPVMFFLTLARTLVLTLLFVYLKGYAIIIVSIIGILPLLVSSIKYFKSLGLRVLLGAIIALFAPCLILHDFSHYYLVVAATSTIAYILSFGFLTSIVVMEYPQNCGQTNSSLWLVAANLTDNSIKDMLSQSDDSFHEAITAHHPRFWLFFVTAIALLISMGSVFFLNALLDPVKKMKLTRWVRCIGFEPLWKPDEKLWLGHVENLIDDQKNQPTNAAQENDPMELTPMNPTPALSHFQALDNKVTAEMGKSLLDFAVSSKKYHLVLVSFSFLGSFLSFLKGTSFVVVNGKSFNFQVFELL